MDIFTDFFLVKQFMSGDSKIKYAKNSSDQRVENLTSVFYGNVTMRSCQLNDNIQLIDDDEGSD